MIKPGAPKYATKRDPRNPTFGGRAAAVAEYLQGPLMPWQRYVADVGLELDRYNPGRWRYDMIIICVPRQSGKTYLKRAVFVDRMMCYPKREILMTAQTGKDARKRWRQINNALDVEKKTEVFKVYASQGSERTEYKKNRSFISPFAPTPTSIHGDSLHLVGLDEVWAFDSESGLALENAVKPTQLTIQDGQIWAVSTMGTEKSDYLNDLIRQGREAVNDPSSRIAYFEWSADEELAERDPFSDETLAFHPAIGHTQTPDKMRALASSNLKSWRRAILNLETLGESSVFNMPIWEGLKTDELPEPADKYGVYIGVDVALDGSAATIAAAWITEDQDIAVKIIATGPGQEWVIPALASLQKKGSPPPLLDPSGPTRTLGQDLQRLEYQCRETTTKEYATACQLFQDKIKAGTIVHEGDEQLEKAMNGAAVRFFSGTSAFDAPNSSCPIDALRAATLAVYAAQGNSSPTLQMY